MLKDEKIELDFHLEGTWAPTGQRQREMAGMCWQACVPNTSPLFTNRLGQKANSFLLSHLIIMTHNLTTQLSFPVKWRL